MEGHELTRACRFGTDRLQVAEWHVGPTAEGHSLADMLTEVLTSSVTSSLPSAWRGDYDRTRAASFIRERDEESPTLLVTDRLANAPVGLLILHETPTGADPAPLDLRLGYLLAETAWGQGLASELVAGFVDWCRSTGRVRSMAAGVEPGNVASARVLTKNGFVEAVAERGGDRLYELVLDAPPD